MLTCWVIPSPPIPATPYCHTPKLGPGGTAFDQGENSFLSFLLSLENAVLPSDLDNLGPVLLKDLDSAFIAKI